MKKLLIALLFCSSAAYADINVTEGSGKVVKTVTEDSKEIQVVTVSSITGTAVLPSGAATAAKQPALGTAGTAATDVITVQGIAAMTALKVDGSAVTQPVSGTVAVNGSTVAVVNAAGNTFNVSASQSGSWTVGNSTVAVVNAAGNTLSVSAAQSGSWSVSGSTVVVMGQNGGSVPVSLSGNQAVNLAQVNGNTTATGNGTSGTGNARVNIASDNTVFTINVSSSIGSATAGAYLVCQSSFVNVAASQTDSVLVGAIASTILRVISVAAVAGGTGTNLTFNSKPGGAGAAISPLFANAANGGIVLPRNDLGWFQTSAGESLAVTTGAGSTTGVLVHYCRL